MSEPLCPELYYRLKRVFGDVRIASPGEPFVGVREVQPFQCGEDGDQTTLSVVLAGEYYRVSCPYCADKRFRLWINHRWGEYPHMAVCYNENCLAIKARRDHLRLRVFHCTQPLRLDVAASAQPIEEYIDRPVEPPGEIIPLNELSLTHAAVQYVLYRGFDPTELATRYGVGYCRSVKDQERHWTMRGRIYIPVISDKKLVGWQGRYVGELDWKATNCPKYYTMPGFKKSRVFYNGDIARRCDHVVLCEGVMDAWSIGPAAAALLGKTVSLFQMQLLMHWALRGGVLVLLLDPGAALEGSRYQDLKRMFDDRVVEVKLPEGFDPGNTAQEDLYLYIRTAARTQGLDVRNPVM